MRGVRGRRPPPRERRDDETWCLRNELLPKCHLEGFTDPNPMEVASERPVIPRPLTWRDRLVRFFTDEPPVDAATPGPPSSPLSISVVDQLQHRAQNMGFEDLSQAFAELAGSRRALSLRTYGSAAREHPALLRTYTAHAAPVLMAIFSADGRNILSASGDCTLSSKVAKISALQLVASVQPRKQPVDVSRSHTRHLALTF